MKMIHLCVWSVSLAAGQPTRMTWIWRPLESLSESKKETLQKERRRELRKQIDEKNRGRSQGQNRIYLTSCVCSPNNEAGPFVSETRDTLDVESGHGSELSHSFISALTCEDHSSRRVAKNAWNTRLGQTLVFVSHHGRIVLALLVIYCCPSSFSLRQSRANENRGRQVLMVAAVS